MTDSTLPSVPSAASMDESYRDSGAVEYTTMSPAPLSHLSQGSTSTSWNGAKCLSRRSSRGEGPHHIGPWYTSAKRIPGSGATPRLAARSLLTQMTTLVEPLGHVRPGGVQLGHRTPPRGTRGSCTSSYPWRPRRGPGPCRQPRGGTSMMARNAPRGGANKPPPSFGVAEAVPDLRLDPRVPSGLARAAAEGVHPGTHRRPRAARSSVPP